MNKKNAAYIFCVLAMFGWGSNFIAGKLAYRAISGLTFLFFRYLIALAILCFVYRGYPRPRLSGTDKRNILLIGCVGYCISIAMQMIGMKFTAAAMASVINTITPVAIVIFAVPFLRERVSSMQLAGILLTVLGSVIIVGFSGGDSQPTGIVLSFLGMSLWGLTSVWIRRSCGNVDGIWLTIYGTAVALVTDIPLMCIELAVSGVVWEEVNAGFWLALLWSGAIATAGANLWWSRGLESLPAATCSLFYALLPIVTTVLGIFILNEQPSLQFILGALVIIGGVIVAILGERRASA